MGKEIFPGVQAGAQTNLHNRPLEIIKAGPYDYQPEPSEVLAEKLIELL